MGIFTTIRQFIIVGIILIFGSSLAHSAAIKGLEEGSKVAFCKQIDFIGTSTTLTNSGLNCTLTSSASGGGGSGNGWDVGDGFISTWSTVNGVLIGSSATTTAEFYFDEANVIFNIDDGTLAIEEGADTMSLTVPTLTADRAVTLPDSAGEISLLAQSIESAEIADNTISNADMADNSIDSDDYVDASIDLAHMSSGSVDSDNIVDATIVEADIDGDVAPVDEDFLQYDSTGANFTWRSDVEVISDLSSAAADWDSTGEVTNDSHDHTTTSLSSIDIGDDTNLTAGTNITLAGDTLNVDDAFVLNTGDTMTNKLFVGTFAITSLDCTGNANGGALTADASGNVSCSDDDGGGGSGDAVTVNSTAIDTTANFLNGDITFSVTDGGAGGPDDVTATYAANSIDFADDTDVTAGTNISLSGSTINVDDAFLINSGNDTTTGVITATGFTIGSAAILEAELEILDGATITTAELETLSDGSDADTLHVHSGASLNDDIFALHAGDVYTGNHDFGGADFEFPQASPAAPDADGETEFDQTDANLVIQQGTANALFGSATDVVIGKSIHTWQKTLIEPDQINTVSSSVTFAHVLPDVFPHGITIVKVGATSTSTTTGTMVLEEWSSTVTFDTNIQGINLNSSVSTVTSGLSHDVESGKTIGLDLDTSNMNDITVFIIFYEQISMGVRDEDWILDIFGRSIGLV